MPSQALVKRTGLIAILVALGSGSTALAKSAKAPSACSLLAGARSDQLVHAPFRVIDGRIYLEARANGRGPFIFALDTGASGMGRIDAALAAALGLPPAGSGESSDGVSRATVDLVKVRSVVLERLERRDMEMISRDYRSRLRPEAAFAGILGREFFADGLLTIDYPNRIVTFVRSRHLLPTMHGALSYDKAFRVPVTIGSVKSTGNLDTGANAAFVLPKDLYDQVSGEPLGNATEAGLTNSTIATHRTVLKGPFEVGLARATDVEVRVATAFPELLVGAHFLKDYALLIDQRSRAVALCPSGKQPRR